MYAELEKLFSMDDNKMMQNLSKSLFPAQQQAGAVAETGSKAFNGQNRGTAFGLPTKPMIVEQFTKMGDEDMDLLTAKERTARRMAANLTFRTPGVKGAAMEQAVSVLDDDYGWRAIQHVKVVAAAKQHPVLARRVNSLVANQIGALAIEYSGTLTSLQGFNANNLSMVGNTLVYKSSAILGQDKTQADQEVPAFVARFNRTIDVAQRYSRVGVLDATKFTTSQEFLNTVQTAVKQQQEEVVQPKSTGTEYVRDADGNIVLKRG